MDGHHIIHVRIRLLFYGLIEDHSPKYVMFIQFKTWYSLSNKHTSNTNWSNISDLVISCHMQVITQWLWIDYSSSHQPKGLRTKKLPLARFSLLTFCYCLERVALYLLTLFLYLVCNGYHLEFIFPTCILFLEALLRWVIGRTYVGQHLCQTMSLFRIYR